MFTNLKRTQKTLATRFVSLNTTTACRKSIMLYVRVTCTHICPLVNVFIACLFDSLGETNISDSLITSFYLLRYICVKNLIEKWKVFARISLSNNLKRNIQNIK